MLPSLMLALSLALATTPPAPAAPTDATPGPPHSTDHSALRDAHARLAAVPMVVQLRSLLDNEPPELLALELHRAYEHIIVDPLKPPARDPQTLYPCFVLAAGLSSLHDRAAEPVAELEARVAFHLHQLGSRWDSDPTFAAELAAWADAEPSGERQAVAQTLAASLDALPAVTQAWFPAARAELQRLVETPSDVHETHYGLWLIDQGRAADAADHLVPLVSRSGLRGTIAATYRALRAAERTLDAQNLYENASQIASVATMLDEVDQQLDDARDARNFAALSTPRPVDAWLAWGERALRQPGLLQRLAQIEAMIEDHPTDPRVARLAAAMHVAAGDLVGLHRQIAQAEARGVPVASLIEPRLTASTMLHSLPERERPEVEAPTPHANAVRAYRKHYGRSGDDVARASSLLASLPAAARGDLSERRVRRAALALARRHRASVSAATFAAGALISLDLYDDAERVLLNAAHANPTAAGALHLTAGRVRLHAGLVLEDPEAATVATQHHADAASGGATAHAVRFQNIQAELLRRSLEDDDDGIRAKAGRWAEALGEVERLLADAPLDRVLRHAAALNLASLSALLDNRRGMFAPLQVARSTDPDDPVTQFVLGQYALSGGDGARAKEALTDVVLGGTSITKRWVAHKWLMFLSEQLQDPQGVYLHREAMIDLFDEARVPEQAPGLHPLLISGGRVDMRLSFTHDQPLRLDALVAPTLIMLADLPHDMAEVRRAHP